MGARRSFTNAWGVTPLDTENREGSAPNRKHRTSRMQVARSAMAREVSTVKPGSRTISRKN